MGLLIGRMNVRVSGEARNLAAKRNIRLRKREER